MKSLRYHQEDLSITLEGARKRINRAKRNTLYIEIVEKTILGKIVFMVYCHHDHLRENILNIFEKGIQG